MGSEWTIVETTKRGTHRIWTRICDGDPIFTVRPIDETPMPGDGGYASIESALAVKGMKND